MFSRTLVTSALAMTMALALSAAAPAQARVSLAEDAHITDSLVAAQVGVILTENCPALEPRIIVATMKAWNLHSYAQDLGYSSKQIDRFLKNKDQKARILQLAEAYLAEAGAVQGDAKSYCAVGRKEINTETLAGELLKEN